MKVNTTDFSNSLQNISIPSEISTVSFDVFDTLIIRPYVNPKDLFWHIETITKKQGFAIERISAEKRSRGKGQNTDIHETTFEQIYKEIDQKYIPYKHLELELEKNSLPYIPIVELYKKLQQQGKKIILISDMYLPSEFIEYILKKNGITGFEKIYVSCEYNSSKRTGTLFKKMMKDLDIPYENILHIGDNLHSDVKVPESMGIKTIHVPKLIDLYFKQNKAEHRFYKKNPTLERSIIVALDAIHWMYNNLKKENTWNEIAFRFGGPAVYDYCRFIHELDENNHLMFIARDGYNLQKVYEILFGNTQKTSYVYAPRIANILAGSKFENYRNYKQILLSKLCQIYCSDESTDTLYEQNIEIIREKRKAISSALQDNLTHITIQDTDVTLVDVTTLKYSSQELISELLINKKVHGIYYFILDNKNNIPHTGYCIRTSLLNLRDNVNIIEFFMTSPEPPVDNIDSNGKPIFKIISANEKIRLDIYDQITNGELQYAHLIKDIFEKNIPYFGHETIASWINTLVYHSDRCIKTMLSEMKWPVDANHEKYVSITFHPRDTWYHLRKKILDVMWFISTLIKK